MITAIFFKDSKDNYLGFSLSGHAGYAVHGEDIVCAGVSALSINAVNSIEKLTTDEFKVNTDEKTGLLSFTFKKSPSPESKLLLDSLYLGLKGIEESYKDNDYLKILLEEV